MKKNELLKEYMYYYESYVYYDAVKKESHFAEINLTKCNLLADLFMRYYNGDLKELQNLSIDINNKIKLKYEKLLQEKKEE